MISIASIVEGDSEVASLPVLLRRLAAELVPAVLVSPLQPILIKREHSGTYRELLDQPAFANRMDIQQALTNSRSFRKLCKEWEKQILNSQTQQSP